MIRLVLRDPIPALSCALGCAASIGSVVHAGAGAPLVNIIWTVDGGLGNDLYPDGSQAGDVFTYIGQDTDGATGLSLSWDLDVIGSDWVVGNLSIQNTLGRPVVVRTEIVLPVETQLADSLLEGQAVIGLTAGVGGGVLSSQVPAVWQARVDRIPVGPAATLFFHPFELTLSGPSSASVYSDFGQQVPVVGPPVLESTGYSLRFILSSADLATIYTNFDIVGGTTLCSADLDGDGVVGSADLVALLAEWNEPGAGDLDGDGVVGIGDLLLLLAAWGSC